MHLPEDNDKALLLAILRDQPDDNPVEDLLRVLAFHRLIMRGRQDVQHQRMVETSELRLRMKSWRT